MGRPAKYRVTLTEEERNQLTEITHSGKRSVKLVLHAQALLALDQGALNPAPKTIDDVASVINLSRQSLIKIKERFVLEGLDAALNRKKQDKPSRKKVFDGDFEATLIQMACSDPPEGFCRWTVRLLAEKLVEMKIVPKVSAMTVQRILKKTKQSLT